MSGSEVGHSPYARENRPACPAIPDHDLIRRIGRGSYGDVWLARNVMGVYRAVKVVYRESFDSDRPYEREFSGIRQFEPVSRSHPSQVNILHVGRSDGCFYYVMELADDGSTEQGGDAPQAGAREAPAKENALSASNLDPATYCPRTLQFELYNRRRLPVNECLEIALALTTALDHLHQHGLVHRDVKPSNVVFIHGIPKLADIGLVTGIDLSHSFVGTEGFIPPEGPGTPAADIYGLGKLLYEISSGKDRRDFPEPPTRLGEFEDREKLLELDEIIQKACASPPGARYRSAAEMQQDLLVLKTGKSLRRTHQLERRLAWMTRVGAATLAIMLLSVVPYFLAIRGAAVARREAGRARLAQSDVREKLWKSYLAEARAGRSSGRSGQRFASLEAIKSAAAIRANLEVRNEAINSLAVSDLRPVQDSLFRLSPGVLEPCFDNNIERYAVADQEGDISIYSVTGRRRLAKLPNPGLTPSFIGGFSSGGRYLAVDYVGNDDQHTIRVWDLQQQRTVITGLLGNIGQTFSPDERFFAASEKDGIHLYSLPSGDPANRISTPHPFDRVAFSPNSLKLACARFKRSTVRIYEVASGRTNLSILCPATVVCLAWSPDGKVLATGCEDKCVYVWDAESGTKQAVLEGHTGRIADLMFHPTTDVLATSGEDDSIRLWNLQTHHQVAIHQGGGYRIQFSQDGRRLGGFKGPASVGLLEVVLSREYRRLVSPFSRPGVAGPDFSRDGRIIVAGTCEWIRFWDSYSGKEIASFLPVGECDSALFHPDGHRLITAERYGGVFSRRFEPSADPASTLFRLGKPQCLYDGQDLRDAALSLDGRHLGVVNHRDGNVIVLDLEKGSNRVLRGHHPQADYIALSPDGRWIATGSWRNAKVMLWDCQSGEQVASLSMPTRTRVVFSPDGRWLGTSSTEYQLWHVGSWKPKGPPIPGHSEADFNFMAFSPDSRLMALADSARNIRLVETATDAAVATLEAPDATPIFGLSFSPDGSQLAALEWDQQLQLWDLRLLREELRQMGLDWDLPPLPKPTPASSMVAQMRIDSAPFTIDELAASIPQRDPTAPPNLIDLTPYYNLSLTAVWHYGDGPSGLAQLPRGLKTFSGVEFDVRGLIRLDATGVAGSGYPPQVLGIAVNRSCSWLHFLYGTTPMQIDSPGAPAGRCLIHYVNGRIVDWPLVLGDTRDDSIPDQQVTNESCSLAWTAIPTAGQLDRRIHLFESAWRNPFPGDAIQSLDLLADQPGQAPFLVALTAQEPIMESVNQ